MGRGCSLTSCSQNPQWSSFKVKPAACFLNTKKRICVVTPNPWRLCLEFTSDPHTCDCPVLFSLLRNFPILKCTGLMWWADQFLCCWAFPLSQLLAVMKKALPIFISGIVPVLTVSVFACFLGESGACISVAESHQEVGSHRGTQPALPPG